MAIDPEVKNALDMRLAGGEINVSEYESLLAILCGDTAHVTPVVQAPSADVGTSNDLDKPVQIDPTTSDKSPDKSTSSTRARRLVTVLLLLGLITTGIYFTLYYHFVLTRDGLKIYAKSSPAFDDTFVDTSKISFGELRYHQSIIRAMQKNGELHYLVAGKELAILSQAGCDVVSIVAQIDNEYELSRAAEDIMCTVNKEIESRYDVSNKSQALEKEAKKAASRVKKLLQNQ